MAFLRHSSVLLVALCIDPSVCAAEDAADKTTARNLAREGQTALMQEDFETAADRFGQARKLVDAPTLHVGYARARAGQGRLVEAYEAYRVVLSAPVAPDSPPAFLQAVAAARKESTEIEKRLAWLTIEIDGLVKGDPVEVKVNGRVVNSATLGAPRPVDPGPVWVTVSAAGYEGGDTQELDAEEGQQDLTAEFTLEKLPEPDPEPVVAPAAPANPAQPTGFDALRHDWQEVAAWSSLGLGVLGVGVGVTAGIVAINEKASLDEQCIGKPPPMQDESVCDDISSAALSNYDTAGTVATVGFIAGGVFLAAGAVMLFTLPASATDSAVGSAAKREGFVAPYLGFGSAGVRGAF